MSRTNTIKKILLLVLFFISIFLLLGCSDILYNVSFDMGENEPALNDIKIAKNKTLTINEPKSKTKKFLYWELDGKKYDLKTPVTKNIHLVAKWGKKDFFNINIKFTDLDDKNKAPIDIKVKNGETLADCKDLPFKKFYSYSYRDLEKQEFINLNFKPVSDMYLDAIDTLTGMPKEYFKYFEKEGNDYIYDITDNPDSKNGLESILFPLNNKFLSKNLFKTNDEKHVQRIKKIRRIYLTKDQISNLSGEVVFYNVSENLKLFIEVDKDDIKRKNITFKFYKGNKNLTDDNITSKISFEYKTTIKRFVSLG